MRVDYRSFALTRANLLGWLTEQRPQRLALLWQRADAVRRQVVGDDIHLRGLIEISNCCRRSCLYCGLRAEHAGLRRYRLNAAEIAICVRRAQQLGCGTVVLQAGEDPGLDREWLASLIRSIKAETPLAVTLSLGERDADELECWRRAGADRYLLRFETSDPRLYAAVHPGRNGKPSHPTDRLAILRQLRELGYEIGSGVMIGIPGQSYDSLAEDLLLFRELDLDMVGNGPYIPHPATPLGLTQPAADRCKWQVRNSELLAYKVLALTRLLCPEANLPLTTAVRAVGGWHSLTCGFSCGANVIMPCLTPAQYRPQYEPYPGKSAAASDEDWQMEFSELIGHLGRRTGMGTGPRAKRIPVA